MMANDSICIIYHTHVQPYCSRLSSMQPEIGLKNTCIYSIFNWLIFHWCIYMRVSFILSFPSLFFVLLDFSFLFVTQNIHRSSSLPNEVMQSIIRGKFSTRLQNECVQCTIMHVSNRVEHTYFFFSFFLAPTTKLIWLNAFLSLSLLACSCIDCLTFPLAHI